MKRRIGRLLLLIVGLGTLGLTACGQGREIWGDEPVEGAESPMLGFRVNQIFEADGETIARPVERPAEETADRPAPDPNRRAFFGDLHVHTTYSFDAYAFGTLATPDDAYRYARGERIQHPGGFDVQLRRPLDFYAVTDHAMFLGVMRQAADTTTPISRYDFAEVIHDLNAPDNMGVFSLPGRIKAFSGLLPRLAEAVDAGEVDREEVLSITRSAWADTVRAADLWNDPGRFTTFAAYEYTSSTDDRGNLHRNVIFKASDVLPAVPFSRFHSQNPEGLWEWMDALRAQGIESLAIPHNSNGSNGQMFKLVDWAGNPLDDAYTEQRLRNEPLVEITQVKGTSETHPDLSETDEWAGFEITPYRVATMLPSEPSGSYVRDALRKGLALESKGVSNPYAFGVVGASDTHTGAISDDEANFFSKLGLLDSTADLRGSVPMSFIQATLTKWVASDLVTEVDGESYTQSASPTYGASGLAGVWAEENTRASIYDAFRRKETFATSGPRIPVRFFAGERLTPEIVTAADAVAQGYRGGVPMGADLLVGEEQPPGFWVYAAQDPASAKLQRLQIIKGWETGGKTFEKVFDVACSDGLAVEGATHRCPDNGARVDLTDCSISADVGDAEMQAYWRDPEFDPGQRAFYYVRVLENPTCRWSTWDALREGVAPRSDLPKTIQERAWSSPIQVRPRSEMMEEG